jgi:hypothetical protein
MLTAALMKREKNERILANPKNPMVRRLRKEFRPLCKGYAAKNLQLLRGGRIMSEQLGICAKCKSGEYLTLSITIGDIICQGCGEWQDATLNDVYARVDL